MDSNHSLQSQLYQAIQYFNIDNVRSLLRYGSIQVNDKFHESNGTHRNSKCYGKTPLQYAVENNQPEIVELLLEKNADVNSKLNSNMSLIQWACQKSNSQIVKLLIDYGADVNYVDPSLPKRYTCLHYAVESNSELTVELLVNKGSFINATAENNITPLHIVAGCKNLFYYSENNILKFLLENGADVNARTADNKTALYFAVQKGHLDTVQTILKHNPDSNIEGNSPSLGAAISCDHLNGIKASHFTSQAKHMDLLSDYEWSRPVDNINSNLNSRYAKISCNHSTIVNLLIEYGLTLEPQHEYYKMFIFAAASIGHLKIIESFLASDSCDVNLSVDPSSENSTRILHTSIINNHSDISVLLIKNGADVNVKDENNKSPVHYAVKNNNTEVTKKLVDYNAEVQPILLYYAIGNNNLEIVKILIKCGVDINTIFEMPKYSFKNQKLTLLLVARSVLYSAVQAVGDIKMIELLLEKGADVNFQNEIGMTPLHFLIYQIKFNSQTTSEMIKLLLKYNADINCKCKSGMTPLHYATFNTNYGNRDDTQIIQLLLEFGADIDALDNSLRTPFYYAIEKHKSNFGTTSMFGSWGERFIRDMFDYDDDEFDFSELRRSEWKIIEMLKEHIVQLNRAKCWINDGNLQAIKDSSTSRHMLDLYDKEISNMKIEKIGDSCVTFHDVLMNDFNKFGRNKNVMDILELGEYKKTYPLYGKIITGNYRRAKFRIHLQKEVIGSFRCQCDGFKGLPYNCVEKICSYLSLQDMRELINSVK